MGLFTRGSHVPDSPSPDAAEGRHAGHGHQSNGGGCCGGGQHAGADDADRGEEAARPPVPAGSDRDPEDVEHAA